MVHMEGLYIQYIELTTSKGCHHHTICIGYITARVLYQIYKNRARGRGFYKSDIHVARVAAI